MALKWASILHVPPNFPSKPLFLEALYPSKVWVPPFLFAFLFFDHLPCLSYGISSPPLPKCVSRDATRRRYVMEVPPEMLDSLAG
jgi:hypothetical protein